MLTTHHAAWWWSFKPFSDRKGSVSLQFIQSVIHPGPWAHIQIAVVSTCLVSADWYLMSDVLCHTSHVSCLMFYVWRHVSWQTSDVICLVSVSCQMSDIWCRRSDVRHLMSHVWCLMSNLWCPTFYVQCLMFYVWCKIWLMTDIWCYMSGVCQTSDIWCRRSDVRGLMSHVWCLIFEVWHLMPDVMSGGQTSGQTW